MAEITEMKNEVHEATVEEYITSILNDAIRSIQVYSNHDRHDSIVKSTMTLSLNLLITEMEGEMAEITEMKNEVHEATVEEYITSILDDAIKSIQVYSNHDRHDAIVKSAMTLSLNLLIAQMEGEKKK